MRTFSNASVAAAAALWLAACGTTRDVEGGGATHDPGWAVTIASGVTPHGLAAAFQDRAAYPNGIEDCKGCHGSNLDNPTVSSAPSCDSCHTGGTAAWRTDCTFCHGDATRAPAGFQTTDAAPPRDVAGNVASARVGAHQAHLFGIATNVPQISNGVACDDCHGGPTRTLPTDLTHVNGTTEVTPKQPGQVGATGSYDPATGTCSNVYCHGNLPRNPKQPANSPSWTATGTQNACGTCHAANGTYGPNDTLTGMHQAHRCASCHGSNPAVPFSAQVGCFACHPGYQRQMQNSAPFIPPVVNRAIHVDGTVDVEGATTGLYNGFGLALTYTAPLGSAPASCTTNCHAISAHQSAGAPQTAASW